jgi:hypothetical protein
LRGFEAGADDAVADTRVGERQATGFLLGGEFRGSYIEEPAVKSGISKMGSDAGAHGSGAQDGDFVD